MNEAEMKNTQNKKKWREKKIQKKTREGRLRTWLYDKRDYFNFSILKFPFICSKIPAAPAYGVYISQLIRYSRACGSYQDFLDRGLLLTRKLLNQAFLLVKMKASLRKVYGRHLDLVDRYGIYVPQVTTDMFHGCYLWSRKCLPFRSTRVHPRFVVGFVLLNRWFCFMCLFCRSLSFCLFSFGHCVVCLSFNLT
jgi:hypothetical protein